MDEILCLADFNLQFSHEYKSFIPLSASNYVNEFLDAMPGLN